MEQINLGTADGLPLLEWSSITAKRDAGSAPGPDAMNARTTWLTTINTDGSPHTTPVGAVWVDECWWFQTGDGTKKRRNLARDPRCALAVSIGGADVIVEGAAVRVTDGETIAPVVKAWNDSGWPAELDPSGEGITAPFNAPAQGPAPWGVYRIDARSALVVAGEEPGGLTRFNF